MTERATDAPEVGTQTNPLVALPGDAGTDWHARRFDAVQNPWDFHANWIGKEGRES